MKILPSITPLLVLLLCCFACNSNANLQQEVANIEQQIMFTHDEVMPRISKVLSLRKQVNMRLDSCSNITCKEGLQNISYQLTKADADMMKWMHQYQKPLVNDTVIFYLKNQQLMIEQVKVQILNSIIAADSILKY